MRWTNEYMEMGGFGIRMGGGDLIQITDTSKVKVKVNNNVKAPSEKVRENLMFKVECFCRS